METTNSQQSVALPAGRGLDVARPKVTGPLTGGKGRPVGPMPAALAEQAGYVERELFIEGTATSFQAEGTPGDDGRWAASPAATAPFKTRLLVRRPADAARFNGTVVVEWLNVSAGRDSDPNFALSHPELLRSGHAWVGVSAQAVGTVGGPALIPGMPAAPLVELDPERYGSLVHPGDDYSYDIYSQAAQAVRWPDGSDPLDGLVAQRIIAVGESQSAMRLVTYINAVHPLAGIFDGFMVHSRGGGGTPIHSDGAAAMPARALIRADVTDPVLTVETETDVAGILGFAKARQPDADRIVTWEIAGTGHADQTLLDYGLQSGETYGDGSGLLDTGCGKINDGQASAVLSAAWAALDRWVAGGPPAPSAPELELNAELSAVIRDELGIAKGGIRTPSVDAPTSVESGEPHAANAGNMLCLLLGSSSPFDADTLAKLYPTHDDYVAAVRASAAQAVEAGFLLEVDAAAMVAEAQAAPVPS